MSMHTTFGIGGPADFCLLPETTEELCIITKLVRKNNLPLFILGGGANLLVRDKGIRGVVTVSYTHLKVLDKPLQSPYQ